MIFFSTQDLGPFSEYLELIKTILGLIGSVIASLITLFKIGQKYFKSGESNRLIRNKEYLIQYNEFLSGTDKEYIRTKINDTVMANITQEKNKTFRDLKIILSNYTVTSDIWFILKKVKRYLYIDKGILYVKLDTAYMVNYWMEKFMGCILALWLALFILLVYIDSPDTFETGKYYLLLLIVFVISIASIWFFINSPRKSKVNTVVNEINKIISES
ncbi:hypothetical protein M5X66_10555 [Providencia sp. PROV188]|uniref:hypothetical protein n=1 Tax=Providencia TaxID=586 RepID=UPI0003E2465F|nr:MULTISPECIES: hypothetical protein [Providencia]ETS99905.1 hypothetical protein HMPREF1568_0220 [Providencia alcalifaciens PAL-3]EUD01099.1 hypothetical protein HMPREF1566_2809 [Providencia alcalifaciens PAL-1]MTC40793.1 hypothetical protein [Providencia sp. wls1921]WBM59449.1 hypothetical protein M5X66_10555 [Providencia sp. PROV188]